MMTSEHIVSLSNANLKVSKTNYTRQVLVTVGLKESISHYKLSVSAERDSRTVNICVGSPGKDRTAVRLYFQTFTLTYGFATT